MFRYLNLAASSPAKQLKEDPIDVPGSNLTSSPSLESTEEKPNSEI